MSPRTKNQWEEIREKSKEVIINAAKELFAEKGFNATSINDIAGRAKVSKGLLYNYYKSKYDLLDVIIAEAFEELDSISESMKIETNNPIESLYNILKLTFESIKEKPEFWKLITGLSFKKQIQERYQKQIQQSKNNYITIALKLFQQLKVKKPMQELLFVGAIIDGMAFHYLEEPDNYPSKQMLKLFKEKLKQLYE